jgi:hypothetical protein
MSQSVCNSNMTSDEILDFTFYFLVYRHVVLIARAIDRSWQYLFIHCTQNNKQNISIYPLYTSYNFDNMSPEYGLQTLELNKWKSEYTQAGKTGKKYLQFTCNRNNTHAHNRLSKTCPLHPTLAATSLCVPRSLALDAANWSSRV